MGKAQFIWCGSHLLGQNLNFTMVHLHLHLHTAQSNERLQLETLKYLL
jgi:hypothetical protein